MKKVAIVGYAMPTRERAPYDDPSFEIWSLCWQYYYIPRADRWFEMHPVDSYDLSIEGYRNYFDWLMKAKIPIYMLKEHPAIPNSTRYPKEEIIKEFGTYFTCTVSWMIALAIYEGFKEIRLYGIHAEDGTPYEGQKAGITFFLGICHGKGIKYYVPQESLLLKNNVLYGYEELIPIERR